MKKSASSKQPMYRYALALILGLVIVFIPDFQPSPFPLVTINLVAGLVLGFIWAGKTWRWGLWISSPMVVIISLSVAFSGHLDIFLRKDLPVMAAVLVAACVGSFAGAWLKSKRAVA